MSRLDRADYIFRGDVNSRHPQKHMGTIEIHSAYKSLISNNVLNSSSCQQGSCLKKALTVTTEQFLSLVTLMVVNMTWSYLLI